MMELEKLREMMKRIPFAKSIWRKGRNIGLRLQVNVRKLLTGDIQSILYIRFSMSKEVREIIKSSKVHVQIHESAKGDYQKARKCYENIIRLLFDGKDKENEKKCIECIDMLVLHADCSEGSMRIYNELVQNFAEFPIDAFYVPQWNAFEIFFMGAGMYRLALVCRKKSLELIIKNKNLFRGTTLFAAYLEKMDITGMEKESRGLKRNPLNRIFIPKIVHYAECYVDLARGKVPKPYPNLNKRAELFFEYIKGKSVLVVGPSENGMDGSYEDAEVVIRIEDWDNQHCGKGIEGRKTNITFLNTKIISEIAQGSVEKRCKFLDSFDFILIKYNDKRGFKERNNYKGTVCVEELFLNGVLNVVPVIIQDLLLFPYRKIHVIGTNIYLCKEYYSKEERKKRLGWGVDAKAIGWRMVGNLAGHNQLLQYAYLRNMFKLGVFSADEEFSRILSMGIEKYAEEMEDIYLCSIPPI